MKAILPLCLLALFAATLTPSRAGELVAIVEDIEGDTGDTQLLKATPATHNCSTWWKPEE